MPNTQRDFLGSLAALALGLAAFLVLVGWPTLLPTNIAWLTTGDRAMHTLGWMFFREAPWQNPPGLSPDLGIELSSSIALVDGLPLFALPLKLIRDWLPQPFQYWGDWLLLSFMLQSLFAYALARELSATRIVALAAAAFALITPAFMFRVPMHLALSGHWTIIAALYLYARRTPPRLWMWPLLVALTASIHAYLLAMVMAVWLAALVERVWNRRLNLGWALLEIIVVFAPTVLVLWIAGFFTGGALGSYGYGDYKLNLLWPFLRYDQWSQLFPALPHTKFDYEGLSFLGIGIMALLPVALFSGALAKLRSGITSRWLPLTIVLVLMLVFAFSQKITFGDQVLFEIPMPKWASDIASTFRSTGRFVWPILYFITVAAVTLIARRFRPIVAVSLVLVALAAQAADSGPQLLGFSQRLGEPASTWTTPLVSPFWERAVAAGYDRIRAIPVINPGRDWRPLGYFAVTHGMDIDSAYLGRNNDKALAALRQHEADALATGALEPHTLYDLDTRSAVEVAGHLASGDLLAMIDGRIVLAKGGAALVDGLGIAPRPAVGNDLPSPFATP